MGPDDALLAALRNSLAEFAPAVATAVRNAADDSPLLPPEDRFTCSMVPGRKAEFAAGRGAARAAIAQLGLTAAGLSMAADRQPIWPANIVGSISHADGLACAVATRSNRLRALGIDLEPDRALEPELWPAVCSEQELMDLALECPRERGRRVLRLFCAKEALFKLQYPLTRLVPEFSEVTVEFNSQAAGFGANSRIPQLADLLPLARGRFVRAEGFLLAIAFIAGDSSYRTFSKRPRDGGMSN
jgi:4'-phosphopantetheinyl transferase EntD